MNSRRADLRYFALYLVLAGVGLALLSKLLVNDANYVLYRFAAHLVTQRGLNYQIPDSTVTTYPLVPLLLSLFVNLNLAVGTGLLCAVSMAVGALFMDRLTGKRLVVGIAYTVVGLIYPSPITLVMLALVLAGLDAARNQCWTASGVLIGLAILADPSALVPAVLIILLTLRTPRATWRYLLPVVLIPMLALALTRLSLGTTNTVFVSIVPEAVSIALPVLAIVSLLRARATLREAPALAILVVWSASAACLALLHGTWPSAVIMPGAIALVSMLSMRYVVVLAAAIDLAINLLLPNVSASTGSGQDIGQWLATHTSAETTVASTDIGVLGYYADRPLIDLSGRLQANPFDKDFFIRSAPDVIVLKDNAQVPWSGFKTSYASIYSTDGQTVYQRVVNFTPLQSHNLNIIFAANLNRDDLSLTNTAVADTVHPGDFVRVRLDWQLNYLSTRDKTVKLLLNDAQGKTYVTALDKYPAEAWVVGSITTYHLLVLPHDLPPGAYSVNVDISVDNGDIGPYKAANIAVEK